MTTSGGSLGPVLVLLALFALNQESEALRCFACTYTTSADQLCIDDPISVQGQSIVPCDKKYCTILRQESVNPAGKVVSFARQCEERPDFLNTMIEDTDFKTYYRSCSSDLCNSGSGIESTNTIHNGDNPGENMMVQGLRNSGTRLTIGITGVMLMGFASSMGRQF